MSPPIETDDEDGVYKKFLNEYNQAESNARANNRNHTGYLGKKWVTENLSNKSILIIGENGIGDEVLTIGLLPELAENCISVSWKCDEKLKNIFTRSFPKVHFVSDRDPSPAVDAVIYSFELIGRFRKELKDFPWNGNRSKFQPYLAYSVSLSSSMRER